MRGRATHIRYGALALRPFGSGVQTYIRELLKALVGEAGNANLSAVVQRDAISELPSSITPVARPVVSGTLRAVLGALPAGDCDLFHGLDVDIPLYSRAPRVATVHDLSVLDVPSASGRFRRAGETRLVGHTLRAADLLIAVSEFTAERIEAVSGRRAVVVELAPASWARVPEAEEVDSVRRRYRLPDKFVLQVGNVEPRKEVHLVAEVAAHLGVPCVLAGAGSDGPDAPATAIGLGYVELADLPALYAAATVTAYASNYEGFGFPPVEAMACGGTVVASAVGALPQVVGDGAVLVPERKVDHWVAAMRPLLNDTGARAELSHRAVLAASTLTWQRTAAGTLRAYKDAGLAC